MKYIKGIFLIIIGLVILVAAIQNYNAFSTSVQFRLNLWLFKGETPSLSIFTISIICFFLGVFVTALFGIADNLRLRAKLREANRAHKSIVQHTQEGTFTQESKQN
jgi:uncharacterized membrane protein YciS (DUF1049 family)